MAQHRDIMKEILEAERQVDEATQNLKKVKNKLQGSLKLYQNAIDSKKDEYHVQTVLDTDLVSIAEMELKSAEEKLKNLFVELDKSEKPKLQESDKKLLFSSEKDKKILTEQKERKESAEQQLYQAVLSRDLKRVEELLSKYPSVKLDYIPTPEEKELFLSKEGWSEMISGENTALMIALCNEDMDIALLLLEKGAKPWKRNEVDLSALHMLCMVHRDMNPEKIKKTMLVLEKLSKISGFEKEINHAAPKEAPRSPVTLAVAFQDFSLLKEFLPRLKALGGKHTGNYPLCSYISHAWHPSKESLYLVAKLYPEEFTTDKLKEKMSIAGESVANSFIESLYFWDQTFIEFCFEKDKKAFEEYINTVDRKTGYSGILHKILDQLQSSNPHYGFGPNLMRYKINLFKYCVETLNANPEMVNPNLKASVIDRIRALPTKSWADDNVKMFAKEILEFLGEKAKSKKGKSFG